LAIETATSINSLTGLHHSSPKRANRFVPAITIAALLSFLLINACFFLCAQVYGLEKYRNTENIINCFQKAEKKPDVVLVGSSLMRLPFFLTDVQHSNVLEQEDYCWNQTLRNLLNSNTFQPYSVFDFAIDGSMVSDVYLVHKNFLTGASAPKWIVYGIAPRDFFDNLLSKETRTPLFDRLFDLKNIWFSKTLFNIGLPEKFDLTFEKFCSLYGKRGDMQQSIINAYHDVLDGVFLKKRHQKTVDTTSLEEEASSKNLKVYKKRYKEFQIEKFEKQKLFLKALCQESQKQGTNILLINMPLSPEIVSLIPVQGYDAYNKTIADMSKFPGVKVLDLHNSTEFPNQFFGDLVHLNGKGGYLLSRLIANNIMSAEKSLNSVKLMNFAKDHSNAIVDGLGSWWFAKAYFNNPHPPDVVVLGGSQLGPVAGADAYVYNRTVDPTGDNRSYTIEHDLKKISHKDWRVLIGALPGNMISDDLAASRALFSDHYKPKLVAIALSPKEFIDNTRSSIKSTEAYFTFAGVKSLPGSLEQIRSKKVASQLIGGSAYNNFRPLLLSNPFERIQPGEIAITSSDGYVFTQDVEKYRKIYEHPFSNQMKTQLDCLDRLFRYLKQLHIPTVAIEMPLSNANHISLPEEFWNCYRKKVFQTCHKYDVDYWDYESIWENDIRDYCDSAHLNLRGGLKFTRSIVLATIYSLHLPMYAYNANFGPLVPGKEKIYFHKTWDGTSKQSTK